jgi:hypothetical protein
MARTRESTSAAFAATAALASVERSSITISSKSVNVCARQLDMARGSVAAPPRTGSKMETRGVTA